MQARPAPGRPPLVHQAGARVAQPHGGSDSFEIDPMQVGLARSGGSQLPTAVLAKMEAAFGADFSAVRVHVGPQASRIGAIAFTTGNDLYFAPGRYQPESIQGQQLIGHELAHVIQQRQGRVPTPAFDVAVVQDRTLEAEADRLGTRAAAFRTPIQTSMSRHQIAAAPAVSVSAPRAEGKSEFHVSADVGGRQVGSVRIHSRGGATAEITDLGVDPAYRERGIGAQLLAKVARAGMQLGKSRLSLTADDNGSGRLTRWYQSMGFARTGIDHRGRPQFEAPAARLLSGAVQRQRGVPAPGAVFTGHPAPLAPNMQPRWRGSIQRSSASDDGKSDSGSSAVTFAVTWLKKNDPGKQPSNFSVGLTDKGYLIVSKVGGLGPGAAIVAGFSKAMAEEFPSTTIYLASTFNTAYSSGNHAEMCVAAGANTDTGKVLSIVCTHPNCDLCAAQMKAMAIKGSSITSGTPGSQSTWAHPTKSAAFGTSFGSSSMSDIVTALENLNANKAFSSSCGSAGSTPPTSGNVKKLQ